MKESLESVFVYYKKMPFKVKEVVTINADNSYSVFINDRLTHENQERAFLHAIGHIFNDDFSKYNTDKIELLAHNV